MRWTAALVLGACVALSGCATSTDGQYTSTTAGVIQNGVLAVTDASASGDPVSALARLDELRALLLDLHAKGAVEQSRFDSISAAIDLVRTDLTLAISTQVDTTPDDAQNGSPSPKPGKSDKPDKPDKPDKKD